MLWFIGKEKYRRLAYKAIDLIAAKALKAKAFLVRTDLDDEALVNELQGCSDLTAFIMKVRYGRRPILWPGLEAKDAVIELVRDEFQLHRQEIIEYADRICHHIFDLLGSGPVDLDKFVRERGGTEQCGYLPWHLDFKTGYRWDPRRFYRDVEIPVGQADIKVPWELSRFHHVVALGQAYWLTGDERYPLEFFRQVDDWIEQNPPMFGVNWRCTMDVAIRLANWVVGFYFFRDAPTLSDKFWLKFVKSLICHGRHIMANLENRGTPNNHYLADLVGLIYLGKAFPEFRKAGLWLEFGTEQLRKQLDRQVLSDGVSFEGSTCYHRLVTELFAYAYVLLQGQVGSVNDGYQQKLEAMFDFTLHTVKPHGLIPQIGDNDDGRLHILSPGDARDVGLLLSWATVLFGRPKYKITELGCNPGIVWLYGPEGYTQWRSMPDTDLEAISSKSFPIGGFHVMRGPEIYCIIRTSSNNSGLCTGHLHCDGLSFELVVRGADFVVDPGTYTYTRDAKERNLFRRTASHNTVVVGGLEQYHPVGVFRLRPTSTCSLDLWQVGSEMDMFKGTCVYGAEDAIHRRTVAFDKMRRRVILGDSVESKEPAVYTHTMHFGENVSLETLGSTAPAEAIRKVAESVQEKQHAHFGLHARWDSCIAYLAKAMGVELFFWVLSAGPVVSRTSVASVSEGYGLRSRGPLLEITLGPRNDGSFLILFATEN